MKILKKQWAEPVFLNLPNNEHPQQIIALTKTAGQQPGPSHCYLLPFQKNHGMSILKTFPFECFSLGNSS